MFAIEQSAKKRHPEILSAATVISGNGEIRKKWPTAMLPMARQT